MRVNYNQYKYYESGYRIPSKMHSSNAAAAMYQHLHHKSNFAMRMTMATQPTMTSRIQRKGFRTPSKRHPGKALPGKLHSITRVGPGKIVPGKRITQRPHPPPCDNSNDSGFGFDQHVEVVAPQQQQQQYQQMQTTTSPQQQAHLMQQQQQHQQQQQQQQQQQEQTSATNTDISINGSSSSSTSSSNSSNHQQNHYHHHHMQQQNLIRTIPAASFDDDEEFIDCAEDNLDLLTDDSNDYMSTTSSTSSATGCQILKRKSPRLPIKRKKLETHVDLENDDACSEDAFVCKIQASNNLNILPIGDKTDSIVPNEPMKTIVANNGKFMGGSTRAINRVAHKRQPAAPTNNVATSQNGQVQLEIVSQPEQQHRARYQTEGSRGAVKDRSGNGFPIVRLIGYNKPAVLQVFIGTDIGRVAPHMFYQACKVAGKNSTQCTEKKVDGTMVIEIDFKPETDMIVTCDCVGILKERNVDVEHRFPDHLTQKNKKKSTRCRMVFRTILTHDNGSTETLQVCSNPIICTQPPGVPEICKKSLNSSPVDGGLELFIIGKNFLKDTHVIFQETYESAAANATDDPSSELALRQQLVGGALWEQTVLPDKEYLQQTHLICTVPPYIHQNILKPVTVQLCIISSGKKSEPHSFLYTPKGNYTTLAAATALGSSSLHGSLSAAQDMSKFIETPLTAVTQDATMWPITETKHEIDSGMMPPPITTQMPITLRRPNMPANTPLLLPDKQLVHMNAVAAAEALKTELMDESSQNSMAEAALHSPEAVAVATAAAVVAVGNVAAHAHTQFHQHFAHKQATMFDNTMSAFPVAGNALNNAPTQMEVDVMAAAVEMAVKNEYVQEIQQQQQQQQQQTVQQQHEHQQQQAAAVTAVVDEIISDLTNSTASVVNTDPLNTNTAAAIENALTDILQQAGVASAQQTAAAAVLGRSLSISSSLSSGSSASPTGSENFNSPISQDLMLNSEPAATLSIMPMPALLTPLTAAVANNAANATAATGTEVVSDSVTVATAAAAAAAAAAANANGLSTEIIMNPAVSPSTVLSSSNGVATAVVSNIMSPHQVTMANSILNDIAMQVEPTQEDAAVAALALSNIMMSPTPGASGVSDADGSAPVTAVGQPEVTTATSTAVSNLIIKAAADLISNQEQQQQQQQQHQQHHQQQHTVQQQQQQAGVNVQQQSQQQAAGGDTLVNLLLSHPDVAASQSPTVADVASAFPLSIPAVPAAAQESPLIVALATDSGLQKSVAAAAVTAKGSVVTQQTTTTTASIMPATVGVLATATVPIPPPIPQELTTMSDQDLLSYINPSTFDQI